MLRMTMMRPPMTTMMMMNYEMNMCSQSSGHESGLNRTKFEYPERGRVNRSINASRQVGIVPQNVSNIIRSR